MENGQAYSAPRPTQDYCGPSMGLVQTWLPHPFSSVLALLTSSEARVLVCRLGPTPLTFRCLSFSELWSLSASCQILP